MHLERDGIFKGTDKSEHHSTFAWSELADRVPFFAMKSVTLRWLRHLLWPKSTSSSGNSDAPRKLRPTAYLDGLRGFAALLVYIQHHVLWAHGTGNMEVLENGFGYKGKFHFATFPFVRNFFTGGHMAVAVFFVISGYVLSVKPLSLIHDGEHLKLFDNIASATFRRWFRLYIPIIATTLFFAAFTNAFGIWTPTFEAKSTLGEELWNWYIEFKNYSFLYKEQWLWLTYNPHTWSIPFEMRGSIIIYAACIALSRATHKARLLSMVVLMWYFLYVVDGYYCALFAAGMLQCDLDLLARREGGYFPRWLRRLEPYKTFILYHLLIIGLFLGGVPSQTQKIEVLRENPMWYWLSYLKPQAVFDYKWFYLFFAGNMIVVCSQRIGWLRRFFETRFCQFLGRVSYALYLVHGPILGTIGDRVYYAVGWARTLDKDLPINGWVNRFPLPNTGPLGLEISFLVANLLLLPLTLWVAEFVTRMVDEPAVKAAAWLYKLVQRYGEADEKDVVLAPLTRVE